LLIYKITNIKNGKIYIGMTSKSLERRVWSHFNDKGSGTAFLSKAIKKHGRENFKYEQIDSANTLEELAIKEIFWISHLNSRHPSGYNFTAGGSGGRNDASVEAHKIPIKCLETGEIFGSITLAANKLSLSITKVSAVCAGRRDSTGGFSFEYLDEQKRLVANKKRESRKDPKAIAHKRSVSGKTGAKARFKAIKCLETGEIFESIAEASRKLNIHRPNIRKHLIGLHKSVQGYTFEIV
jgi:group I intron endonuclease